MIRVKINSILALLILVPVLAYSQAFKYKCEIKTPDSSGFYSIDITPELSSHLKTDLTDVRIVDNKGRWVPHIVRINGTESQVQQNDVALKILSIQDLPNESILVVSNDQKVLVNNFLLRLKNAAAERMASLSGSDDNKKWFIISDSNLLAQPLVSIKDENVKQILFPSTQYRFFKITVKNSGKDPLNILAVTSQVDVTRLASTPLENPRPLIHQQDSSKWSLIEVNNGQTYQFDQLRFEVKQPALFERVARVYLEKKDGIAKMWDSYPVAEMRISSAANVNQPLPLVKAKEFFLLVSNEDNPPLEIGSVRTFQPVRVLVAYLEKGQTYQLAFDDPNAGAPNYDLKEFTGKIPAHVKTLAIGNFLTATVSATSSTTRDNRWWIWLAIAVVIFVLAYLTWQLIRDMNRKNEAL